MSELGAPSKALAEKLLTELDHYEDRLTGWKTTASTGYSQSSLYSLQEVLEFLQVSDPATLLQKGGHAVIGYVDLEQLQQWIGETLGDRELAEAVRERVAAGTSYADRVGPIRELLEQRLAQSQATLA